MKLVLIPQLALIAALLTSNIPTKQLHAEQLNCFEYKNGSIKFFNCDHACSTDKNTRFNSSGKCSVCGHLLKKQPDFFIESGTKADQDTPNDNNQG